jgi:hypothetical protein
LHSGVGIGTRKLYANDEEQVCVGRHPVILASDSPIEVDAQIADISLTLVLRPFGPRERKTERTRLAELEQVQAGFLGYLLDTLALILGLDDYTPVVLPRLAEFATVGARAEGVLWPDGAFADAYARARLANSPAISYVLRFGFARREWAGTATELLGMINQWATAVDRYSTAWPSDAAALGKQLHASAPVIRELGLSIDFWRAAGNDRQRSIILRVDR